MDTQYKTECQLKTQRWQQTDGNKIRKQIHTSGNILSTTVFKMCQIKYPFLLTYGRRAFLFFFLQMHSIMYVQYTHDLTFPMRHLYSPGAVQRIWVEVRKARRQNCPCFTIDIASTKSYKEKGRDRDECGKRLVFSNFPIVQTFYTYLKTQTCTNSENVLLEVQSRCHRKIL